MAWRYVITDSNGVDVGEPRATQRTLTVGVSTVETASFRIRADDPLWQTIAAGESNLKVFDSIGGLRFYGPIISDEESATGQGATVQCTASSVVWRLGKRFAGKDVTNVGTTYTTTDSGQIMVAVLNAVNAEQATGITVGTVDTFVKQTVTYLWKRVLDALGELGSLAGSYEWQIGYGGGTPPGCALNLRTQLGQDRTQAVFFEYGTGTANCSGYSRARSIDGAATRVWAIGNGSTIVSQAFDAAYETTNRYEDVITYGSIGDAALLDTLATLNVAIRKRPRTIVQLTPFPKMAPLYGVDWFVGDLVNARVMVNNTVRVSGTARIWGADISIDELGNETATLKLEPQA